MKTDAVDKLAKRAIAQIVMLSAALLLGMAVNLIGLPSETEGGSKVATMIFLGVHVAIGIGLVIGSLLAVKRASAVAPRFVRHAWMGVAVVAITFISGVLVMATESNWWSYLMATGFLAAFLLYGAMFVHADRLRRKS